MPRKNNKHNKKDNTLAKVKRDYDIEGTVWYGPPGKLVADSSVVWLDSEFQWRMNNAAVAYVNNRIIATGLGSAMDIASEGFTAYYSSQIPYRTEYTRYRVLKFVAQVTMFNQETAPVVCSCGPSNDVIAKNLITFYTSRLNRGFKSRMCTQVTSTSSARFDHTFTVDCKKFVGSKSVLYDDSFVGATNPSGAPSVPSNNIYINVGAFPENGTTAFANGVTLHVLVKQLIEFFEPSVQGN